MAEFGNIYGKLETMFDMMGEKCCVNSVFGNVNCKYLYKSGQDLFGSLASTVEERRGDFKLQANAVGYLGMTDICVGYAQYSSNFSTIVQ